MTMEGSDIHSFLGMRHPFSASTHLLWCAVSVFVGAYLWRLCRGDRVKEAAVGCFAVCTVVLYACSTFYHTVPASRPELVHTARKLDFTAIYLLIAGSYTPLFAVLLTGRLRVRMLSLVWGLAAVGIACRWLMPLPSNELSLALYVVTGAAGLLPTRALLRVVPVRGFVLLLTAGLCYAVGGLCDALHWPVLVPAVIGGHEVLHVLDIFGTLTHFYFVAHYVVPSRRDTLGGFPGLAMDPVRSG
jgi:hemolysin III